MQSNDSRRSEEVSAVSREIYQRTDEAADELKRARSEIRDAVSYFRWWRFLDYDPAVIDFLEKLDMPN